MISTEVDVLLLPLLRPVFPMINVFFWETAPRVRPHQFYVERNHRPACTLKTVSISRLPPLPLQAPSLSRQSLKTGRRVFDENRQES